MAEQPVGFIDLLPVLEHVDYIVGCFAIEATGQAKYELSNLVETLEQRPELAQCLGAELAELREAQQRLRDMDYGSAASHAVRASEWLWQRVCPVERGLPSGTITVTEPGKAPVEMSASEFAKWQIHNRAKVTFVGVTPPTGSGKK